MTEIRLRYIQKALILGMIALLSCGGPPIKRYSVVCLTAAGDTLFVSDSVYRYQPPTTHFLHGSQSWRFDDLEKGTSRVTGNCVIRRIR